MRELHAEVRAICWLRALADTPWSNEVQPRLSALLGTARTTAEVLATASGVAPAGVALLERLRAEL
ncbi:MAG: hypothetical protein R3F39_18450 [Myxococcota bacterium]